MNGICICASKRFTFGFCDGYNGGVDQILNFFPPLSLSILSRRDRHDRTRSDPGNPVKLRNYRAAGHTLLSCLACFVLLAFARFTVNSDITH